MALREQVTQVGREHLARGRTDLALNEEIGRNRRPAGKELDRLWQDWPSRQLAANHAAELTLRA